MAMSDPTSNIVVCQRCNFGLEGWRKNAPSFPVPTDWLRANYVPSSSQRRSVEDTISKFQIQLQFYEDEIAQLYATAQRLEEERDVLLRQLQFHESLISPVRTLPNEILMHIFLLVRDDPTTGAPAQSICNPVGYAPMNLSLVCRLWRDIVLAQPQLWSNISVDFCDIGDPDRSYDVLDLFLRRSEQSPLTLTFYAALRLEDRASLAEGAFHLNSNDGEEQDRDPMWDEYYAKLRKFVREVVTALSADWHAQRWCRVQILGLAGDFLASLGYSRGGGARDLFEERLHKVKDMTIDHNGYRHCFNVSNWDYDCDLRAVHVYACVDFENSRDEAWSLFDFHCFLEMNSKLESVILTVSSPLVVEVFSPSRVQSAAKINTIASFELRVPPNVRDGDLVANLFTGLTLPCLTALTISFDPEAGLTWPHEEFMSLLSRSECTLQKVAFHNVPIEYSSLEEILQSISSSLSHLTISHTPPTPSDVTDTLVVHLLGTNTDLSPSIVLPSLTHLDLQLDENSASLALLHDVITSRAISLTDTKNRAMTRLEEVTIRLPSSLYHGGQKKPASASLPEECGELGSGPRVYIYYY